MVFIIPRIVLMNSVRDWTIESRTRTPQQILADSVLRY